MSTEVHRQVAHAADMGLKRPPQTVDSASGPDNGDTHHDGWSFPWNHRVSEATETSSVDLMKAKEKQQHAEDKEFIERYYNQQSSKRKRHNENKKERLWQSEERLAMSAEDINIQRFNNAASGFKPNWPFFPIGEHSAPLDRWPEQMIDKCYPKARTCHHSRHLPQLDNQQHWSWQWVEPRPPYGIQLLEEFGRWKANQWWSKWSCSAEPYRYAGLMTCRTGKQWHRCALRYPRRLRASYITWSLLAYPLSPVAKTLLLITLYINIDRIYRAKKVRKRHRTYKSQHKAPLCTPSYPYQTFFSHYIFKENKFSHHACEDGAAAARPSAAAKKKRENRKWNRRFHLPLRWNEVVRNRCWKLEPQFQDDRC